MSFFSERPPLRVKICGITRKEDALMAIDSGTDALGFNFYAGSKRFLDFAVARCWIAELAGRVDRVAVVVNAAADVVAGLRDSGCFEAIQFHGDESPEDCARAAIPLWLRAVRVRDAASLDAALAYETPFLLLDAWTAQYGGSGLQLDWKAVRDFVDAQPGRRVVLAGGLTPDNVGDAVTITRPHGVDVASGVEASPGFKDEALVRAFVRQARGG